MIDLVAPRGNEAAFIEKARRSGIEGLCFLYNSGRTLYHEKAHGVKIFNALLNAKGNCDLTVYSAPENDKRIFEKATPDVIFNLEKQEKDYLHHRGSGLNQVMARLAAKHKIIIAFSFRHILENEGVKRAEIIGRIMQNIAMCKKFKVEVAIASFAATPEQMRSHYDLKGFFEELGMDAKSAQEALSSIDKRITLNRSILQRSA